MRDEARRSRTKGRSLVDSQRHLLASRTQRLGWRRELIVSEK